MRLPRYMKATLGGRTVDEHGRSAVIVTVRIAWWGWPILFGTEIWQQGVRWWQWPHVLWTIGRLWVGVLWQARRRG